jgi:hypothetical protein
MPITLERIPHDKQVAVATFADLGYSQAKISRSLDISRNVVHSILAQFPSDSAEVEHCKKTMISKSYGIAHRAFNRVTDEKLDAMNALQLTTIGAIGIDKARDMEGSNRPVFNIINVAADLSKRLSDIKQKQAALMELRSNTSV